MTETRILEAARIHIPFDGFSLKTLLAAIRDLGLDPIEIDLIFPRGGADLARLYARDCDRRMLEALAEQDLAAMKIRQRIATAIRTRLTLLTREREVVRRLVQFFALPLNSVDGLEAMYHTVDAMWQAAGDTSTDFNFYTKRMTLAAVYGTTLIYWLSDDSEDFADTWAFLDRRIENVMQFETIKAKVRKTTAKWPDLASILGGLRYSGSRRG